MIVRVARQLCALAVADVIETMRPLPIVPLAGALPPWMLGVSIVRARPTVVIDAAALLGSKVAGEARVPSRFVTIRVGSRTVALAVDEVVGIRAVTSDVIDQLPTLVDGDGIIETLGTVDSELVVVLRGARLVSEELIRQLEEAAS